jgi:hypothetical protein
MAKRNIKMGPKSFKLNVTETIAQFMLFSQKFFAAAKKNFK